MSQRRKVKSAQLKESYGANALFGAEPNLNPSKQSGMIMETDGAILYCRKNGLEIGVPLSNLKGMEFANEEVREAGAECTTSDPTTARGPGHE